MPATRTTKILGFSVPPAMVDEIEEVAKEERKTKSELFREMFNVYKRYKKYQEKEQDNWVMGIIRDAQEGQKYNSTSGDKIIAESDRLSEYGVRQSKKLGIKIEDVNDIIYERRKK